MKLATVIAATILSLASLAAQAVAPTADHSFTVKYADLNLDSKAGIVTLHRRIRGAAERVCDEQARERLVVKQSYAACVERATSAAVARINRPMLTEYVAQRSNKRVKSDSARVAVR